MRRRRIAAHRWRRVAEFWLLCGVATLFTLALIFWSSSINRWPFFAPYFTILQRPQFKYRLRDNRGREVTITELLLPAGAAPLAERAHSPHATRTPQSVLLMWDVQFDESALRGCPDWKCAVTQDRARLRDADAVFMRAVPPDMAAGPALGQYFVHYSQESPVHAQTANINEAQPFNMSFGFRMDTPAASPYGFAARLAPESRPEPDFLDKLLSETIMKKRTAVAWFVSNCGAPSGRAWVAEQLRARGVRVDIYGGCGTLKCPKEGGGAGRGGTATTFSTDGTPGGRAEPCRQRLDTEYFFYFAAENSICKDYLTEKIWDQGLDSLSVPIVLRRSLARRLLPPHSFIAVDDYASMDAMADHLRRLIADPGGEYFNFFRWRTEFVALTLNDRTDPRAERLFGVCQVCRLTQMAQRPAVRLPASTWREWWDDSCEQAGALIKQFEEEGHDTTVSLLP